MTYQKLLSYAFDALSRRNHSAAEIRKKLEKKEGEREDIEKVIRRLEELNYLNDQRFVDDWLKNRARFKPRGIMMLRQELFKKGIKRDMIDNLVTSETVDEIGSAMKLLEKNERKLMKLSEQDRRNKIFALLRNKGFRGETIYKALESW